MNMFYRTIAGSEIDFVLEVSSVEKVLLEVKYTPKIKEPLAMRRFTEKYLYLQCQKIVLTKEVLKKEDLFCMLSNKRSIVISNFFKTNPRIKL